MIGLTKVLWKRVSGVRSLIASGAGVARALFDEVPGLVGEVVGCWSLSILKTVLFDARIRFYDRRRMSLLVMWVMWVKQQPRRCDVLLDRQM